MVRNFSAAQQIACHKNSIHRRAKLRVNSRSARERIYLQAVATDRPGGTGMNIVSKTI